MVAKDGQSLVLVTGASGYAGQSIVKEFLDRGYRVRGTVRTPQQAQKWREIFHYNPRLEYKIVSNITLEDSFEGGVLDDVDFVVHTAAAVTFSSKDPQKEVLDPTIVGTLNILGSAAKRPQIKRVVLLSSIAAVNDVKLGHRPGHVYTEHDWDPITAEEALASNNGILIYTASKTIAEKKAWEFIEANKGKLSFDFVAFCPPMILGPLVTKPSEISEFQSTLKMIWDLVSSGQKGAVGDPIVPGMVDVRDLAKGIALSLEITEAGNQRYIPCNTNFTYQQVINILREKFPEKASVLPIGDPKNLNFTAYTTPGYKARNELGLKYLPIEVTVEDMGVQFLPFLK